MTFLRYFSSMLNPPSLFNRSTATAEGRVRGKESWEKTCDARETMKDQ
jgi:hypothetical protein